MIAEVLMDRGDLAGAARFAQKSIAADTKAIMSHFILGVVAQRSGRYEEALGEFRKADDAKKLLLKTKVRTLHANMGDCLARLGRTAEAEAEFLEEIREMPASSEGRIGLALLYRSEGRDSEVRSVLEGLITATPQPDPAAYLTVIRTFVALGDAAAAQEWAARARTAFPRDARFGPARKDASR